MIRDLVFASVYILFDEVISTIISCPDTDIETRIPLEDMLKDGYVPYRLASRLLGNNACKKLVLYDHSRSYYSNARTRLFLEQNRQYYLILFKKKKRIGRLLYGTCLKPIQIPSWNTHTTKERETVHVED
jgi:hypothetical protein